MRTAFTAIETRRQGEGASSYGIYADSTAAGRIDVDIAGGSIVTQGDGSVGILLEHFYAGSGTAGAMTLDIGGGATIATSGELANAIEVTRKSHGHTELTLRDVAIGTAGAWSRGVWAGQKNDLKADIAGDVEVNLLGGVRIDTEGANATAVYAQAAGNDPAVRSDVKVRARGDNRIVTAGDGARGIEAALLNGGAGDAIVDLRGASVTTKGIGSPAIFAV